MGQLFGEDAVVAFCDKFDIDLIIRAHQVRLFPLQNFPLFTVYRVLQMIPRGFKFFADRRLVTIFSAPNYCGTYTNSAAMLKVDENLICKFKVSSDPNRSTYISFVRSRLF